MGRFNRFPASCKSSSNTSPGFLLRYILSCIRHSDFPDCWSGLGYRICWLAWSTGGVFFFNSLEKKTGENIFLMPGARPWSVHSQILLTCSHLPLPLHHRPRQHQMELHPCHVSHQEPCLPSGLLDRLPFKERPLSSRPLCNQQHSDK